MVAVGEAFAHVMDCWQITLRPLRREWGYPPFGDVQFPWIAPADIDTRGCGQIHCETRHEQVIVGRHSALDAFPSRRGVFPHTETCLRRMLHELIADHHLQRS